MRSYKTKRRNSTIAEGKRRDIMDNEQKKLIEQRKKFQFIYIFKSILTYISIFIFIPSL